MPKDVSDPFGSATMSTGTTSPPITPEAVQRTVEAIAELLQQQPEDPWAAFMRAQGHPPEQWVLVLPKAMVDENLPGGTLPPYVLSSMWASTPLWLSRAVAEPWLPRGGNHG